MFKRLVNVLTGRKESGSSSGVKTAAGSAPLHELTDAGMVGGTQEDFLVRQQTPQEVESTLSAAAAGDLGQQSALYNAMCDTWGKLACNDRVLGETVCAAPWQVMPATDGEGKVTDRAAEKAALIEAALHGMCPAPHKTSELGRDGMMKALVRGEMTGHQVLEVLWEVRSVGGKQAILPRALKRVSTRHYGYQGNSRDLLFRASNGGTLTEWPEGKFLIHVAPAHDAHPSCAGRWRTLCKYWGGITYGWEWLLTYANKFGMPFRFLTYKKENSNIKAQLLAMAGNLGIAGYGVFPEGTKLELHDAKTAAGDLPMPLIMKLADQACDLIFLGETVTSGNDSKTGFSEGGEQGRVRRSALQGYCNNICPTLNQLVTHVMMLNYGDDEERPEIVCELPEPEDAKANAETDEVLTRMGLPLTLADLYERHDKNAPADGEAVLLNGRLVKWSDTVSVAEAGTEGQKDGGKEGRKDGEKEGRGDGEMKAAKAKEAPGLAEVMEQLLINAVISGAEEFEREAAAADEREKLNDEG